MSEIKSALAALNQKPIGYYSVYKRMTGSLEGAVLLSQIMYWMTTKEGDWLTKIYKTDAEIIKETGLSDYEFKKAKSAVKKLEFIVVTLEGIPAKTNYKFNFELYLTSLAKYAKLDWRNTPNKKGDIRRTSLVDVLRTNTESTTESTAEITNREEALLLSLQAKREQFPDLFDKDVDERLTPEQIINFPVEWISEAVDLVLLQTTKTGPVRKKMEMLNNYVPVVSLANTFLHDPGRIRDPVELTKLWNRWRAGPRGASIPDTKFLEYCLIGASFPEIGMSWWYTVDEWLRWDKQESNRTIFEEFLAEAKECYHKQ